MTSLYMNLTLPTVSVTIGPAWATQLNAALTAIDAHDHSSLKGALIPTAGIHINANLDLHSFKPYNALSLQFISQSAPLTGAANAASLFVQTGNLYYTNSAGNAVQLTSGGSISAAPGAVTVLGYLAPAGNLSIAPGDTFVHIAVDTTAPRTITLPSAGAVTAGRFFVIKDKAGASLTNPITITPDGADTIDAAATLSLNSQFGAWTLTSDGVSNWHQS